MFDEVTIQPYAGLNDYGQESYGAAIRYTARVSGRVRRITALTGEEKVSTATIVLLNSTGIDPRSLITLPEGFVPSSPPILAILRDRDDRGAMTETIYT
jgi:hypothetical protein